MLPLPHHSPAPYSLYFHIPFCTHRCAYCDFNTYAGQEELIPAYVEALCKEIEYVGARFPSPYGTSPEASGVGEGLGVRAKCIPSSSAAALLRFSPHYNLSQFSKPFATISP